jgi:hypothetical protein
MALLIPYFPIGMFRPKFIMAVEDHTRWNYLKSKQSDRRKNQRNIQIGLIIVPDDV